MRVYFIVSGFIHYKRVSILITKATLVKSGKRHFISVPKEVQEELVGQGVKKLHLIILYQPKQEKRGEKA